MSIYIYIYNYISLSVLYIQHIFTDSNPKERQKYRKVVQFWNPMLLFAPFWGLLCVYLYVCVYKLSLSLSLCASVYIYIYIYMCVHIQGSSQHENPAKFAWGQLHQLLIRQEKLFGEHHCWKKGHQSTVIDYLTALNFNFHFFLHNPPCHQWNQWSGVEKHQPPSVGSS